MNDIKEVIEVIDRDGLKIIISNIKSIKKQVDENKSEILFADDIKYEPFEEEEL